MKNENELIEKLAQYIHDENWAGWMEYLFSKCDPMTDIMSNETGDLIIPKETVDRWMRQMRTTYNNLSEREKESDRREAKRILQIIKTNEE